MIEDLDNNTISYFSDIVLSWNHRIQYAKETVLQNKPAHSRSLKAPEFLTDFGLRKSTSQFYFIEQVSKKLGITLPTEEEIVAQLMNCIR